MNNHLRTLQGLGRAVAYYPSLNAFTGSPLATLMLCQLIYWTDKTQDPEGWIYKTQKDWEEEIGLTRRNQETARKKLVETGLIEEQLRGLPARLHFRVNQQRFNDLYEQHLGTGQTDVAEPDKPVCTNPPNTSVRTSHSSMAECAKLNTEITTESTSEITSSPPGPISEESSTSFDVQSSSEDIPDPHSGGDIPSLFPENEPTNTPETNHQIILDSWNQLAKHHNVTPASKLTAARKSHINARLKDRDWRNSWREAMKQIPDCPFLVGDNDKGWRADLEWFLRPDSVTKILEGKYTRSKAQPEEEISDSLKELLGYKNRGTQ